MNDINAKWMDLYMRARDRADEMARRSDEIVLGVLAGENCTIFGTRVVFSPTWPDGLPLGMTDDAQLRDWATDQLAQLRSRQGTP